MSPYVRELNAHYGQPELLERILETLLAAGLDPANLTPDDLAPLDEFHVGGRDATRQLLKRLAPTVGVRILDLGCGVGGPARNLAQCCPDAEIVGVDIVAEYCRAARKLNELTGFDARITIREGDVRALPPTAPGFDVVWSQHALMNIPQKAELAGVIRRQLGAAGGAYAFHEAFAGRQSPPLFPVPWATGSGHSFLMPAGEWRQLLLENSFVARHWEDVTDAGVAWIDRAVAARRAPPSSPHPALSQGPLIGSDAALKSRNLRRNLVEGRVRLFMGVFDVGG